MRKLGILTGILFLTLLFVACNNKEQGSQAENSKELQKSGSGETMSTIPMSGWKSYGLQGQVKSAKYDDGSVLLFNSNGNIEQRKYGIWDETRVYQSPTKYTVDDVAYQIVYDSIRTETPQNKGDDSIGRFDTTYEFDSKGRISKITYFEGYAAYIEEYKYINEKDWLPNSMITSGSNENFSSVSKYEYLKKDKKGNWLERKVNETTFGEDGGTIDKIEKREIVYFK